MRRWLIAMITGACVMPALLAILALAQAPQAVRIQARTQRRLWRPERERLLASS